MKLLLFLLLFSSAFYCNRNVGSAPVYVEYYKTGDTLFPSYVCPDTLIVKDARGLNEGMGLVEQRIVDATDEQIDSILHRHCIDINQ